MASRSREILNFFSPKRIAIPIVIGVIAVAFLLWKEMSSRSGMELSWSTVSWWLIMALLMVVMRDLAYMYRIRVLTDNEISWRNSFDVIMLWEFASAVTPSVVGGAGIAVFIINRENISLGRSTATVMTTALLDQLFYITTVPIVLAIAGTTLLFPSDIERSAFGIFMSIKYIFLLGYLFNVLLSVIIIYAIFFNPNGFKNLLLRIFSVSFLKRWKEGAQKTGEDMITTSHELKGKPFLFWFKAYAATFFAWTARFWIVNFIILSFSPLAFADHFQVYARQLVMWVIMLISPTPGSTGVAEVLFPQFLGDFITQASPEVLGVIWRTMSYWPYLIIGVIVLPKWIQRVFLKRKLIKFKS